MIRPEDTHIINLFYDNKIFYQNQTNSGSPFLDRDGTFTIKDVNYICDPDEVELVLDVKKIIRHFLIRV